MIEFRAVIEGGQDGGAWVEIPPEVVDQLGGGGRIPVAARFDGHPYRGSIAVYSGQHVLGVVKAVRRAIGKEVGETIQVELANDNAERMVEVPGDMKDALAKAGLAVQFGALSYTKRRQAVEHIESSKAQETRARRIEKFIDELGRVSER